MVENPLAKSARDWDGEVPVFVDRVEIFVKAGDGGRGMRSVRRSRYKFLIAVSVLVSAATIAFAIYRYHHTAGNAEVLAITDRIATGVAAGDRSALEEEPTLQDKKETIDWLLEKISLLAGGYRVRVQRNGENGYLLFDESLITHIGVIETAKGKVSLGFRRDSNTAKLELVTCAGTTWMASSNDDAAGDIRTGSRGD